MLTISFVQMDDYCHSHSVGLLDFYADHLCVQMDDYYHSVELLDFYADHLCCADG